MIAEVRHSLAKILYLLEIAIFSKPFCLETSAIALYHGRDKLRPRII